MKSSLSKLFYYGWVNVVVAAIAMSSTLPGRTYGLGMIKEEIRTALGISDLRFNFLNFWAVIIGAIVVLPVGRLIDRIGSRATLVLVSLSLGTSVLFMAHATNEWQLAATLTLVRGFGQGALSLVAIALVGKWFRRRVGVAMGVFTVLLAIGFVAPIFLIDAAVKEHGWRFAWNAIGYFLLLGLAPLAFLFARSSPESYGVEPDEPALTEEPSEPMSFWQTLATPSFWVYTAAATCFNLTFSALTLDNQILLREHGLNGEDTNKLVLGVLMFSGLPANLVAGYLARDIALGKLLAVGLIMLAFSLGMFPFVTSIAGATVYAVLLGFAGGVITVIYFAVYGRVYGRTHLGLIQASVQVLSVFASAIGPVLLAAERERSFGATQHFFLSFAVFTMTLAILAWTVPPPSHRERH